MIRLSEIPGTTKLHRLEKNLGATAILLSSHDLAELERAAFEIRIAGDRYPTEVEQMTNR